MAKPTFPIVPVLLIGGGALAVYLLSRPKAISPAERAPGVPPSGIVTPETPGAPQGQAYTRVRSPYILASALPEVPPEIRYPTPRITEPITPLPAEDVQPYRYPWWAFWA